MSDRYKTTDPEIVGYNEDGVPITAKPQWMKVPWNRAIKFAVFFGSFQLASGMVYYLMGISTRSIWEWLGWAALTSGLYLLSYWAAWHLGLKVAIWWEGRR